MPVGIRLSGTNRRVPSVSGIEDASHYLLLSGGYTIFCAIQTPARSHRSPSSVQGAYLLFRYIKQCQQSFLPLRSRREGLTHPRAIAQRKSRWVNVSFHHQSPSPAGMVQSNAKAYPEWSGCPVVSAEYTLYRSSTPLQNFCSRS